MDRDDAIVRAPSRSVLRELACWEPGDRPVLSLYLNLDPVRFATPGARDTQLTSALHAAENAAGSEALRDWEADALREDVERVRAIVRDETGLPVEGAAALAVFSGGPGRLAVLRLPEPVETRVRVAASADLEPLGELATRDEWAVLLVNRQNARLFRGTTSRLHEVFEVNDLVHGQHSAGGWSQARWERSVEQDKQNHWKHTAEMLFTEFQRDPFDRLAIGTMRELMPAFEDVLHPYLRERLAGRFDVDVEHSSAVEICDAARPLFEQAEQEREREAIEVLRRELGTGGRAAADTKAVRDALDERRVETLLVLPGRDGPGDEIDKALQQAADVLVVRHHDDLASLGGIAAILRW